MTLPYGLANARDFLDSVDGRWGIVFDKDCDGISSASLIVKYMETKSQEPVFANAKDASGINISSELLDKVNGLDYVIFCDMPLDQTDFAEKVEPYMLIIDHHLPEDDLNGDNVIHINPRFEDEDVYTPTAYLAYLLTQPFSDDYTWLAGIGVVADYGVEDCMDIIEEIAERHPGLVGEELDQESLWESQLGTLANMITAAYGIKGHEGATEAFEIVTEAESPGDILSSRLSRYHEEYQGEVEAEMDEFERSSRHFPETNAYIHEVDSEYKIMSVVASHAADKHPDAVLVLYRETAERIEMSARCQSGRVDVAELIKDVTKNIGSGGGHPQAAGAEVALEHKQEFLSRLHHKFESG